MVSGERVYLLAVKHLHRQIISDKRTDLVVTEEQLSALSDVIALLLDGERTAMRDELDRLYNY